jgi:acyl dehydratase
MLAMATDPSRAELYYEDLNIGRVFHTDSIEVTREEIIAFASRYDPQPFHLDEAAAKDTAFGNLVSSGWLTAALTMRLMILSEFKFPRGVVGLGVDALRWPRPVLPGDKITAAVEITAMRASASKPAYGVVRIVTTTTNQRNEVVQTKTSNVLVPRRTPAVRVATHA